MNFAQKARTEVDELVAEFHQLAESNQDLDWEIPSQYARILTNVERMDAIEARLGQLQVSVLQKEIRRGHLRLVK